MQRRIWGPVSQFHFRGLRHHLHRVGHHFRRGLLLYGACVGGSIRCYLESSRADPIAAPPTDHWDWSIPHHWYDATHKP